MLGRFEGMKGLCMGVMREWVMTRGVREGASIGLVGGIEIGKTAQLQTPYGQTATQLTYSRSLAIQLHSGLTPRLRT